MLRSWAVPRGLPDSSAQNRLAVAVPDHDLDHLTYEDEDKDIADIGWWEEHDRNDRRIVFTLHGRRNAVRYALIQTSTDWLLHRTKEQPDVMHRSQGIFAYESRLTVSVTFSSVLMLTCGHLMRPGPPSNRGKKSS